MNTTVCYANPEKALLNDFFGSDLCENNEKRTFTPEVDVVEQESEYRLYADIAGMGKKDV